MFHKMTQVKKFQASAPFKRTKPVKKNSEYSRSAICPGKIRGGLVEDLLKKNFRIKMPSYGRFRLAELRAVQTRTV